eukprot:CAMPEP_0181318362 /NCGR_PEP_ID=MMETSP1101-20121128/16964_1 /TAXON_ID=46948 /ORGANISM="Rhodomonas abbreviata, Strain Caron Lab Isolate" /LENGTH=64 /DNA_ID=CAMNT_0023425823 /DNA_START=273 /DNA_END=467 /DNA_ORIENTATION=+
MFKQHAAPVHHARGYFGIDAKAYGYTGHVDSQYLKVPSPHKIFSCAQKLNDFNDGWSVSAPSGC